MPRDCWLSPRLSRPLGWTPIIAARDVSTLVDRYRVENISVVQAPVHKSQAPPGEVFRARSFADIAASCGFQRLEALWPVVVAWDSLLDLIKPAAVVADYCPILPLSMSRPNCGRHDRGRICRAPWSPPENATTAKYGDGNGIGRS